MPPEHKTPWSCTSELAFITKNFFPRINTVHLLELQLWRDCAEKLRLFRRRKLQAWRRWTPLCQQIAGNGQMQGYRCLHLCEFRGDVLCCRGTMRQLIKFLILRVWSSGVRVAWDEGVSRWSQTTLLHHRFRWYVEWMEAYRTNDPKATDYLVKDTTVWPFSVKQWILRDEDNYSHLGFLSSSSIKWKIMGIC